MARLHAVECFMAAGFPFFSFSARLKKIFFSGIDNDVLISMFMWV